MEANALFGPDEIQVTTDVELTIPKPSNDEEFDDGIGDLDIFDDVVIRGDQENLPSIKVFPINRIFHIAAPINVEVSYLLLEKAGVSGVSKNGGAILNDEGSVSLFGLTFRENRAGYGAAVFNAGTMTVRGSLLRENQSYEAGAIFNAGTIDISDSVFELNRFVDGSAIFNEGELLLVRSRVTDNGVEDGAIATSAGSTTTIIDSTIARNGGEDPGGIGNRGDMTILRSTISENIGDEGGILNHDSGSLRIINSTISANVSSEWTGGIVNLGTLWLIHSTVTANQAPDFSFTIGGIFNGGTAFIQSSIIAGNFDLFSGGDFFAPDCLGTFTSLGYNIIGDLGIPRGVDRCTGFDHPTDIVGPTDMPVEPLLGPLADNGGFTFTHALLPESPAIDAIPNRDCKFDDDGDPATNDRPLKTDQRLMPRRKGGTCDIGAYEFGGEE